MRACGITAVLARAAAMAKPVEGGFWALYDLPWGAPDWPALSIAPKVGAQREREREREEGEKNSCCLVKSKATLKKKGEGGRGRDRWINK